MPAGEEEKKEEANRIIQRGPNDWLIEGLLTIEEFKDFFKIEDELPDEEEDLYKTLAGSLPMASAGFHGKPIRTCGKTLPLKSSIWIISASIKSSSPEIQITQKTKKKKNKCTIKGTGL